MHIINQSETKATPALTEGQFFRLLSFANVVIASFQVILQSTCDWWQSTRQLCPWVTVVNFKTYLFLARKRLWKPIIVALSWRWFLARSVVKPMKEILCLSRSLAELTGMLCWKCWLRHCYKSSPCNNKMNNLLSHCKIFHEYYILLHSYSLAQSYLQNLSFW